MMISKETMKEIIISQQALLTKLGQGTPREKDVRIEDSFALIITGVRRCGKSTFLNQLWHKHKNSYYLNLEDPRLEGFELTDFTTVEAIMHELYGRSGIYFLDEIQNVPKWEKFVRYLVDKKERIVVTGSNASLLSRELGTKLTGRHLQIEMFPFSFQEFLDLKKGKASITSFDKYMEIGGFPEFVKKENAEILHELLSDVVVKDIAVRFGIKNVSMLNKLAIYLISHVGKEFSYNAIKEMFKIKAIQSVIDYISYCEDAYLIFVVPRFSFSYKKQQINPKKVYSIDNGFSSNNSASFSKDKGKMLENVVFLALRRKYKYIFYYKEESECDFIVKQREKITTAIQACYNLNEENKDREINGMLAAMKAFGLKEGLILTYDQDDELRDKDRKIVVRPVWKWLMEQ